MQRLYNRNISVRQFNIFADNCDFDFALGIFYLVNHSLPIFHFRGRLRQVQFFQNNFVQAFSLHNQRHFINSSCRAIFNNSVFVHVAEQRNFFLHISGNRKLSPANQNVRLNTNRTKFLDAVLRRLGLEFTCRANVWQKRNVDIKRVIFADFFFDLANCFKERQTFNIADSSADFCYYNVRLVFVSHCVNTRLNFVGNVRNNLHGRAEIIAFAFFVQHSPINFACCRVGMFG